MSEKMEALQSQLQVLQQRAILDEAVEKQVDEVVMETSVLRIQIAQAESERDRIN